MKINFKKVLIIGLVGMLIVIIAEVFQIIILKISGVVILAVAFVINAKMLMRRIERLENGH